MDFLIGFGLVVLLVILAAVYAQEDEDEWTRRY